MGGTLSANAHGRDLDVMQVVDVVQRFRLMLADGEVVEVSRAEQPELFSLVIGGYGLYGVILDVTLKVTRDELYEQRAVADGLHRFPAYFAGTDQGRPRRGADAGPPVDRSRPRPLPEGDGGGDLAAGWPPEQSASFALTGERNVIRDKFFFGLSRRFDWAKSLRWKLQKKVELGPGDARIVSRNNSMRPPLAPLELLDYHSGMTPTSSRSTTCRWRASSPSWTGSAGSCSTAR